MMSKQLMKIAKCLNDDLAKEGANGVFKVDAGKVYWYHVDDSETATDDMWTAYCEVYKIIERSGYDIKNAWQDNDSCGFDLIIKDMDKEFDHINLDHTYRSTMEFTVKNKGAIPTKSYSSKYQGIEEIYLLRGNKTTNIFTNRLALSGMWINSQQLEDLIRIMGIKVEHGDGILVKSYKLRTLINGNTPPFEAHNADCTWGFSIEVKQ